MTSPKPLRTALAEAVRDLVIAEQRYARWQTMDTKKEADTKKAAEKAYDRLGALIAQVPMVFEAREEEDA